MRAKLLIATVAVGNLVGVGVTSWVLLGRLSCPQLVRFLCECCWAVLAFPLLWAGLIASSLATGGGIDYPTLWGAAIVNACLWGWVASKVGTQIAHSGFDPSTILLRIARLRENGTAAAHARSKHLHTRRGLLAATRRTLRGTAYFSGEGPEHRQSAGQEVGKNEPQPVAPAAKTRH